MTDRRLKSGMLIQAGVRMCSSRGVSATVVRRGDPDGGVIYIKINRFEYGCVVLSQVRMEGGQLVWLRATGEHPVTEVDADDYIQRQVKYDPDLWVLEVEDREGRNPFEDPVV